MMQESVCQATVRVTQPEGLHLRPLSMIAETSRRFESQVRLHCDERSADASNVLDLMTLNAQQGAELLIEARGIDARESLAELVRLFETNFSE